jgi:hypothetical protein
MSISATDNSNTLDLLDHMTQMTEQPEVQPVPIAELSPVLGLTQNQQLLQSVCEPEQTSEECITSKIQIVPLGIMLLSWLQEEHLSMAHTTGLLEILLRWKYLKFRLNFVFHPLTHKCFTYKSTVVATSYLVQSAWCY